MYSRDQLEMTAYSVADEYRSGKWPHLINDGGLGLSDERSGSALSRVLPGGIRRSAG